jgi:hypothetical protein
VLTLMSRQEAHYRGYMIRGEQRGLRLRVLVQPTKAELPILFRHAFYVGHWTEAVREAERLIDGVLSA